LQPLLKRYQPSSTSCFRSALATIPVFWSSETEEAKNCLSQLYFPAQPAKTDRRVFLAPSQMNQNAWDFASAAAFFDSFLCRTKKNMLRCTLRKTCHNIFILNVLNTRAFLISTDFIRGYCCSIASRLGKE
jgi:hypothetical protein